MREQLRALGAANVLPGADAELRSPPTSAVRVPRHAADLMEQYLQAKGYEIIVRTDLDVPKNSVLIQARWTGEKTARAVPEATMRRLIHGPPPPDEEGPAASDGEWPFAAVNSKDLARGLALVKGALPGKRELREGLKRVQFCVKDEVLQLTTTDGHRIHRAVVALQECVDEGEGLLPDEGLPALMKALKITPGVLLHADQFAPHEHRLAMWDGEQQLMLSVTTEGRFPNVEAIFPKDFSTIALVNRAEFITALKRISKMSNEKVKPAKLIFDPRECSLEIQSEQAEYGDTEASVSCASITGEGITIGANCPYFLDAIKDARGEWVEIGLNKPLQPMRLNFPGEESFTAITMPLRIEW